MTIKQICREFQVEGDYLRIETIKFGLINSTYKAYFFRDGVEKPYIVQQINKNVFKDPVSLMENIYNVTEFIRQDVKKSKTTAKRDVLHFSETKDGKHYFIDEKGEYWRVYRFIDDSTTYNETSDPKIIYQSGLAFGEFIYHLKDYDAKSLYITIPHFHNTKVRYEQLEQAIKNDSYNRVSDCMDIINELMSYKDIACELRNLYEEGKIPLRVNHNDTKCNNVLFDKCTGDKLCVIDLDTIMPGLVAHDYGDAIRFTCSACKEDETDLRKVHLDFDKFKWFTKGFMEGLGDILTVEEKKTLYLGPINMALELSTRFLADYLNGDKYFRCEYPGHNLDRAICQLTLAKDMIAKKDIMNEYIYIYI